jgi:hypothetical protein
VYKSRAGFLHVTYYTAKQYTIQRSPRLVVSPCHGRTVPPQHADIEIFLYDTRGRIVRSLTDSAIERGYTQQQRSYLPASIVSH